MMTVNAMNEIESIQKEIDEIKPTEKCYFASFSLAALATASLLTAIVATIGTIFFGWSVDMTAQTSRILYTVTIVFLFTTGTILRIRRGV